MSAGQSAPNNACRAKLSWAWAGSPPGQSLVQFSAFSKPPCFNCLTCAELLSPFLTLFIGVFSLDIRPRPSPKKRERETAFHPHGVSGEPPRSDSQLQSGPWLMFFHSEATRSEWRRNTLASVPFGFYEVFSVLPLGLSKNATGFRSCYR